MPVHKEGMFFYLRLTIIGALQIPGNISPTISAGMDAVSPGVQQNRHQHVFFFFKFMS